MKYRVFIKSKHNGLVGRVVCLPQVPQLFQSTDIDINLLLPILVTITNNEV